MLEVTAKTVYFSASDNCECATARIVNVTAEIAKNAGMINILLTILVPQNTRHSSLSPFFHTWLY